MRYKKLLLVSLAALLPGSLLADAPPNEKPSDPFDYNFCGGERVYPVVGIEFSTVCGPRNMIALGRRGKLSWFFPDMENRHARKGTIKLDNEQLLELSLLAEVAQVSPPAEPAALPVQYKMGIDFSGRPFQRIHTGVSEQYLPSTRLMKRLLQLVPDQPLLPECDRKNIVFDPIKTRIERERLYSGNKSARAE